MKKKSVDILVSGMKKEVKRSTEGLKSPRHPKPYFISYLVRDVDSFNAWARYGALNHQKSDHTRQCYADVRVGSYAYDQVTKGGLSDNSDEEESYELIDLPVEDDEDSLRFCLWRLTDAKYREAVKAYHNRKARDVSFLDENKKLASFSARKKAQSRDSLKRLSVDKEKVIKLIKKLSKLFKDFSHIKNAYVEFSADLETKIFVSSEGVERVWQVFNYQLTIYMWHLTKKSNEDASLVYHFSDLDELPSFSTVKKEILERVEILSEFDQADLLTSYAGPVLLSPKAAGLLIHEVAGHRLEGSRLLSDDEGRTFKDKIGKKIMHEGLSLYDDPSLKSWKGRSLVGAYKFDDEGCPPEKVTLVEDGVLRGFLNTRSPCMKKSVASNGHARNQNFERPISRMANLVIQSKGGKAFAELKKDLIEEIKRRKIPFGIILYDVEGGETGTEAYNFQAFMGEITLAVKVFPNGKEKYVRGVDFVGTPLSSLNHIVAVGNEQYVDNGYCGAESGTIPVSTVAPSLLLSNLELQAKDPTKVTQYKLPLPWFDSKKK